MPTDISPRKIVQTIIQWALSIQALNVAVVYTLFGNRFLRENFPFGYFFFLPPTFHYLLPLVLFVNSTVPGFRDASRLQLAILKVYQGIFQGSGLQTRLLWWSILNDLLHLPRRNPSHANEAILAQVLKEAVKPLIIYCTGRYFLVTKRGKIGIGPRNIEPGDSVCSLFGCSVPFILRPGTEIGTYRLLGETYVDGIMDEELFQQAENGDGITPAHDWVRLQNSLWCK
jgi:hypothetical protein